MLGYDAGASGSLVGEYDAAGNLIQETVWLGDIPVATLRPSGSSVAIYYVVTDQLNAPREVVRPSDNAVMWSWFTGPFGAEAPNTNPQGAGTFSYDLRLPGQIAGAWGSMFQNDYRDYDPAVGRYVESDPIGLAGGSFSTYTYTDGSPISKIDPSGLAPPNRTAPSMGIPALPTWPSDTQLSYNEALALQDWLDRVGNGIATLCKEATDECFRRYDEEVGRCSVWHGRGPRDDPDRWYRACKARAADRYRLCTRNKGQPDPEEPGEWSQDDIPNDVPGVRK